MTYHGLFSIISFDALIGIKISPVGFEQSYGIIVRVRRKNEVLFFACKDKV